MVDSFNPAVVWEPFGAFSMVALQGRGRSYISRGKWRWIERAASSARATCGRRP